MSALHGAEHERRLLELCAQAGDPRTEFDRSELSSCAECRSALDEMQSSEDQLRGAGAEFRRASEAAASLSNAPGEERVERFLRERLAATDVPTALRPRSWLRPVLLAAAVVLAIAIAFLVSQDRGQEPVFLGGSVPGSLAPDGEVERWESFSWEAQLPEGGWFRVLIYDASGSATDAPVLQSPLLTETRWSPAPEEISKLPRRIRWEVRALDASGQFKATFSEAWLSSP